MTAVGALRKGTTPVWTNNLRPYDLLADEQVESIHEHAMTILETIGVDVLFPEAVSLLAGAGQQVDGDRVRLDRHFVMEQVATAPHEFRLLARNPEHTVTIGGNHMVNAPVYGTPFVSDLERGRRGATLDDFRNFVKLAQSAPQMHCAGGVVVEPEDAPLDSRHLDMVYALLRWSDKPIMGNVISPENARDSIEMASIALGGREVIERTPGLIVLINVNSPLRFDDRMLGALFEYVRANQPVIVTPFLMAGAMSPMGLAGSLAQQTAEALTGIAIAQLVRPGAPCVYGSFLTNTDMQSGSPAFGTPETALGVLASAQMARHYRLPFRGGGALTSSKVPDGQAAYESMMGMWPTVLGHTNFVLHAAGWLESALLASYEKFVMDLEVLRMFEWVLEKGIPFDDEGFAMDAIEEVGPGGYFLGAEHTMRHFRTGFYRPLISSTDNYERWNTKGGERIDQVANRKWKEMLEAYEDPGMDPAVDEELLAFMARRREEIAREGE